MSAERRSPLGQRRARAATLGSDVDVKGISVSKAAREEASPTPAAPSPKSPGQPSEPLDEVLRAVNRIRTAHGADPLYELPRGRPAFEVGSMCVLERAFVDMGVHFVDYHYGIGKRVRFEHGLSEFVRDFDAGRYPELVE